MSYDGNTDTSYTANITVLIQFAILDVAFPWQQYTYERKPGQNVEAGGEMTAWNWTAAAFSKKYCHDLL